jgi:outer membrane beta-barrel protein
MYPKRGKLELNLLELGGILNQSMINSTLVHGSVNYFPNEVWGLGLDAAYVINADRDERTCLENFYYNPDFKAGYGACGPASTKMDAAGVKMGPAYLPIRELKYLLAVNGIYNVAYGKQLYFLSWTQYFDLYFVGGAGLAMSDYYELTTVLRNGNESRPPSSGVGSSTTNAGASSTETTSYGTAGRPDPTSDTSFMVDVGVGQKIHFARQFNFKVELRDYLLLGTPSGFETYLAIVAGLGMRF